MSPSIAYAPSPRGHVAHQVVGDQGPWLVLLPTLTASSSSYWRLPAAAAVLDHLAAHCRLILVDRRGTGPSDPLQPGEAADAASHGADVAAVLAHLDATDVVLVGESYAGGPAALHAATLAPERVARVVVANLPLTPVTADLGLDAAEVVEAVLWGASDEASTPDLNPSVADDATFHAWAEEAGRATSPGVARAMWEAMLTYDLGDVVAQVTNPVTVLATGHWSAPDDGVAALAAALTDATVVPVPRRDSLLFLGDNDHMVAELVRIATGTDLGAPIRRRLRAVVFTDLVDSTGRAAAVGDRAWRALLDTHDAVVTDVVAAHGGRLVKQTGDGALATFPLASSAIVGAAAMLDRLGAAGLAARAGVHVGEVELRGDDVGGVAVHVAARVAGLAAAGEVLASEVAVQAALGAGLTFRAPTDHDLRGVPGQWALRALDTSAGSAQGGAD